MMAAAVAGETMTPPVMPPGMEHLADHLCMAKPLRTQHLEHALSLDPLLRYVGQMINSHSHSDLETSTDADTDLELDQKPEIDAHGNKSYNGIVTTRMERRSDKTRLYNFSRVKKSRKWLKNILLSDSSSDEDDDEEHAQERIKEMLRLHKYQRRCQAQFYKDKDLQQYQYYSVGLLSNHDKFAEHQKMIIGPKKKLAKEQKKLERKMKAKKKKMNLLKERARAAGAAAGPPPPSSGEIGEMRFLNEFTPQTGRTPKLKKLTPEQIAVKRRKIWVALSKKEIPKAQKQKVSARKEMMSMLKKVAKDCTKEVRRAALQSQRIMKETPMRARRLSKEMMAYWKRFEKVEKEHRRRAEKEAQEQRKMDGELREMKRQQRKLNFLITQTELYAHFMARKLSTGDPDSKQQSILRHLDENEPQKQLEVPGGVLQDIGDFGYNPDEMKALALKNAENAYKTHAMNTMKFDGRGMTTETDNVLANPSSIEVEHGQPDIFEGKLKGYQLKGMNWLANLYNQGINGILADEMGLGKTVQSIALLGHLAEYQNIWGPFLIIAPASTLHNWQQECTRFIPKFKAVPYWGNTQDRKILRKFWNQDHHNMQEASFHLVITSYQIVIQDVKYFQRIRWHYMILDEAQALKSTSSVRWKILLGFNCRNRLLLTGTPIQNSMAELWALLHFIMPTLFDSHDEFNEWFSKDIESHAEKQSGIDEEQLSRLHMILKPFMLRRAKKDVENELSDKIEILVYCPLTTRQRHLYQGIKNKISIEDLLQSTFTNPSAQSSCSSLMNLVMQFRKVCNHPELFERREVRGPIFIQPEPYVVPKLIYREGILEESSSNCNHLLFNKLYIFNPVNIHSSLHHHHHHPSQQGQHPAEGCSHRVDSCFSFTRFIHLSPAELNEFMLNGLLVRWLAVFLWLKQAYRLHQNHLWHSEEHTTMKYMGSEGLLLSPQRSPSLPSIQNSECLSHLVFTSHTTSFYTHGSYAFKSMAETIEHLKIRVRHHSGKLAGAGMHSPPSGTIHSPPANPTRSPTKHSASKKGGSSASLVAQQQNLEFLRSQQHPHFPRPKRAFDCQRLDIPSFLYCSLPKLNMRPQAWYCSDRSAAWQSMNESLCGTLDAYNSLLYGTPEVRDQVRWSRYYFHPMPPGGLMAIQPKFGYSGVYVPDKEVLVTDAGKLYVLDTLLARLKSEGHRVLIYSQMTRMIDLLEEYMWHRKHTYMRLDGSSKISERRDMVADFQTRSDIFVFLLSTRAGGLGINLTAADTVIFYDSDWNPTVDQQAMDRAHRLGQTKQVTVYRLICKGSIEERILQRAKEKSEIQRMVISGGNFRSDTLKPKEVVSLLLDDDDMEKKLKQKQDEKKAKEDYNKEKDRKRKREKYATEKKPSGRGPGRPRKKRPEDDINMTIPAPSANNDADSILSVDSAAASPGSVKSLSSMGVGDESSNDALVIVDDAHSTFPPVTPTTTPPPPLKRGGRPRGRPRGSGVGRRSVGRGSLRKAIAAAEIAGAEAGKSAAYAAYGYSYSGSTSAGTGAPTPTPTPTPTPSPPSGTGRGFYSQQRPK